MILRYLLDENTDPLYATQLHRQQASQEIGLVVWVVGDPGAPKKGTLDPDILLWCESHDFALVTKNRRSMPVHLADHLAQGRHVPAIIILNPSLTVGETIEQLLLLAAASLDDEFRDKITFLPHP